ncbi:GAF domain-containing protein [Halobacterium litoreum]|uniref:GAF domain-containing protein n=1 Tax=Halobacterium litoreum TaxID=2039234 RepID=A0ABD5NIW3_9EURY|nr:GAF domain-containing protein [Halobacterium litoreum]UHH12213.1 GAF domain-containing protein [Halobacterium litoreum]
MNHESYLRAVGLPDLADVPTDAAQRGASLVARPPHATASAETVEERYVYPVPEEGEDGACGVGLADEKYNLAPICGLEYDRERLRDHPNTARLVALHETVQRVAEETNVDWVGVYRRATNPDGEEVLVKEAYVGDHSRAEFPLTEAFAERSNNSTVGLTGDAVLVNDVEDHDGPYYECDGRVESEFCCPILAGDDVIGIVDAEAHEPGFFTEERVLTIAGACAGLADSDLLTPPRVEA